MRGSTRTRQIRTPWLTWGRYWRTSGSFDPSSRGLGQEIDRDFGNIPAARLRALCLRHLVEQICTDTMLRFGRAFGPRPLAFDAAISRLYHDLSLYIRQSHAESDLEELGRLSLATSEGCRPTNAKTEQPG